MAKRSIDFTKERLEKINRLIDLMGIAGVYGEIPKAIDFGVSLAINYLEQQAKVTPCLNADEMRYYFNSVRILQQEEKEALKGIITSKTQGNVTP